MLNNKNLVVAGKLFYNVTYTATFYAKLGISNANMSIRIELEG